MESSRKVRVINFDGIGILPEHPYHAICGGKYSAINSW